MKKLPCVLIGVVAAALGLFIFGCSGTDGDKSAREIDKLIVLKIDDQKIDGAVLEKFLESRPVPMNAGNAGELMKKKVDELVVEELLYREALRLKLDQAPDTRQRIKEILNQKLSEEQIYRKVMLRKIEQPELQAYYDGHQDEFNRPEEVRVADVFIAVPKDASNDQRVELKQKAEKVLAEALASTNQRAIFPQLIQKYSDQPEKYAKGYTGFFSADGKPNGIDPRIVEAALKLDKSGDISNTVTEADDGYHIIMLYGKRVSFNKPFEQVARELEKRIRKAEVQKRRDEFIQELKAKAKIVIDEKAFTQIQEKLRAAGKMKPMTQAIPGDSNQPPVMTGTPFDDTANSPAAQLQKKLETESKLKPTTTEKKDSSPVTGSGN
jgi:parvulin-like peptidyl-prolyl isomerase